MKSRTKRLEKRVKSLEKTVNQLSNYVSYLVKSGDLHHVDETPEEQPQEETATQ